MVIQSKIKILDRGKLSRIIEIKPLKIETRAIQGQNSFALDTRESLRGKIPVFLACCGGSDETRSRDVRRVRTRLAMLISTVCPQARSISVPVDPFQSFSIPCSPSQ